MVCIKRLLLDVLKPHQPNILEFANSLAELQEDIKIKITVVAVDEKTESIEIEITNNEIDFERVSSCIKDMGGSIHSIDEVEVGGSSKRH